MSVEMSVGVSQGLLHTTAVCVNTHPFTHSLPLRGHVLSNICKSSGGEEFAKEANAEATPHQTAQLPCRRCPMPDMRTDKTISIKRDQS